MKNSKRKQTGNFFRRSIGRRWWDYKLPGSLFVFAPAFAHVSIGVASSDIRQILVSNGGKGEGSSGKSSHSREEEDEHDSKGDESREMRWIAS